MINADNGKITVEGTGLELIKDYSFITRYLLDNLSEALNEREAKRLLDMAYKIGVKEMKGAEDVIRKEHGAEA